MARCLAMVLVLGSVVGYGGQSAQQKQFLAPNEPAEIGFFVISPYEPTEHLNLVFDSRDDWTVPPPPAGDNPLSLPVLNALHRLSNPGQWLYAIRDPGFYEGALEGTSRAATAKDVIRYDAATETRSLFFCGDELSPIAVPDGRAIDAIYLEGGDDGALVLSFDEDTNLGTLFERIDLARFTRTGPGCGDWQVDLDNKAFAGAGRIFSDEGLTGSNVVGAAQVSDGIILTFDVATNAVGASGTTLVQVGQLVRFDGADFFPFETLIPWDRSAYVAAVSLAPPTCTHLPDADGGDPLQTCAEVWETDGAAFMTRDRIEWKPVDGASSYNVYTIPMNDPLATPQCLTPTGTTDTQFVLDTPLLSGEGLFILISWKNAAGVESDLGRERPPELTEPDDVGPLRSNPCPCPCS